MAKSVTRKPTHIRGNYPLLRNSASAVIVASLLAGCGASFRDDNPSIGKLVRRNLDIDKLKLEQSPPPPESESSDVVEDHQKEAIENYRAYIALLPEGPAKQQAMRRLADLLVTQGPQTINVATSDTADLGPSDGVDGTDGPTGLYQKLINNEDSEQQRDVLRYQLARAYLNEGKPGEAVEALRQLVQEHPDSKLVGEANLRRGELQFIRKEYEDARQAYEAVLADEDATSFHEQSLYKLGWSLYKLERYEDAIDKLHELLDPRIPKTSLSIADTQFDPHLSELPRAKRELIQDALRVTSLSFAWLEASKSIDQYLASQPKRHYESLLYARLGELYLSSERYRDAARTWQRFVENNIDHPHAPLFSSHVIDAWEGAGFLQPVLEAKADYAQKYAPQGPFWGEPQVGTESGEWVIQAERAAPHVISQVRTYTQELAKHYHAVSQKPGGGADDYVDDPVSEASKWYEHFLSQFPAHNDTPTLGFLYAELLFENQRWEEAALQYTQSAYEHHRHEKSADAAYGAVLAWRKHKERLKAANNNKFDDASIAASEQMITSSLKLADNYPDHPEVAPALVAATEDLYVLGELPRTVTVAARVINFQPAPKPQLVFTAWLMTAQAEYDQSHYEAAENAWVKTLALSQQLEPNNKQKHANYIEQLAATIYHQAEAHLRAEQPQAAVDDFLRVVTVTPTASIVSTAHFDAANTLMQMESWEAAVAELNTIRQRYPESERQPQVDRQLATAYLALKQPGNAAQEFQRIGLRASETAETRREALWRSAELYDEATWATQSTAAWERYLNAFPQPFSAAIDARQRLIELALAAGNGAAALKWQQSLLASDQSAGQQSNSRSRYLASRAAREIAALASAQYEKLDISQPFKASLKQKKAAMKNAIDAWQLVRSYQFADQASEAGYRLAEIQANLAESLIYSEKPKGLSELAREEYQLLLEEQAEPFEASAIKAHEGVTRLLIDQDILDTWVRRSAARLARLYPARWKQVERGVKHVEADHAENN